MKKVVFAALLALAACGSYRNGKGSTYYSTFFGLSVEALVHGDGFYVKK